MKTDKIMWFIPCGYGMPSLPEGMPFLTDGIKRKTLKNTVEEFGLSTSEIISDELHLFPSGDKCVK
ncbi:hypothetical protein ACYZFV_01525 [Serratia ureilytica]